MTSARRLSIPQVLAYAAPGLGLALLTSPFPALIAAFYAEHTGATTAGIGVILLVIRLADAFIDPTIGTMSDRTRTRIGPRKPWLIAGAGLGTVALGLVFQPPRGAGDLYFAVSMALYYLALATLDIPLKSWSSELTTDYQERSRIAGYLTFALLGGGFALLLLPNILSLPAVGVARSADLDVPMMAILGRVGMAALPCGVLAAVLFAPVGRAPRSLSHDNLAALARSLVANRPFVTLISADVLTQVGWGLTYAVLFIALEKYFGLGPQIALIIVVATLAQIVVIPACSWASRRIGKHAVWGWSSIVSAVLSPVVLLLPHGGSGHFLLFATYAFVTSALGTPNMMFPMAMIADVSDYERWKSGQGRTGSFYAVRLLCLKGAFAVGNAGGFLLLAAVGFNPKSHLNSAEATGGMLVILGVLPGIAFLVAGLILLRYALDARRHGIVRRRLERRDRVAESKTASLGVAGAP